MPTVLGISLALTCIFLASASSLNNNSSRPLASCTVTSYSEVKAAISDCTEIIIDGITVPAGDTLTLDLKDGTTLTFKGTIRFEYKEWGGPLVKISGNGITIQGAQGSVLDGQGALYWDGLGTKGKVKPRFMRIKATGGSQINDINILNCPVNCVSIGGVNGLTLDGWNIDCADGDANGGHNTDGFDISSSTNVVLKNAVVKNQDDCVAVSQGSDLQFSGLYCSGSHGLSLSVGMSSTSSEANTVSNVVFSNCTVVNSRNGIHIKTHTSGTTGSIKDVTYKNIQLSDITYYGINVQEDYDNGGSTGTPKGNIPISNLMMTDIKGSVTGSYSMPVYILCGENGCFDWSWSDISITGGEHASSCNFMPDGFTC